LPAAWRVYRGPLTQAIDVTEQLALGTFPLRQRAPDENCTPATALRTRPPGGGFVYAFEFDPLRRERERLPRTPRLPPAARPGAARRSRSCAPCAPVRRRSPPLTRRASRARPGGTRASTT